MGHELHALVLRPRETDLFPIIPARHASVHVQVVIRNNAQDDVGSGNALSSLCRHEFPSFLDLCIDIFLADAAIRQIIVRHVVYIILDEEIKTDYPWAGADDLVDPFTVPEYVAPLLLTHHNLTFLSDRLVITGHAHDQVDIGEELLGLFKNAGMANMIHVKHSISVDANWPAWISAIVFDVFSCTHGAFPI